ncbi:hypothetical protein [Streptomyces sp. NPDC017520]|uniref:hypothetical protein n=1 Tax=Streptomyces sp. NPDC017520 TaxID=3364998 RepID=UPI003795F690
MVPSCSVKRRARVRAEQPACTARSSTVSGSSSLPVAHSTSGASEPSTWEGWGGAAYCSFIHAPAGSWHIPQTTSGCTLFVFYPEG